ncbi:PREDICTED: complement component 1 Q subcomponent-binding protein, mitochondrial-like [Amphimedon queenslandica]|uniref:Complement component 1 Q subcomponent-binding protein, mitochondrial n=1 Tax=Amphimedon queenslandica TaxID=400682 RepID=A0A1X7V3H2_AMPQE|nr:PREDICTED: complement component 1 Q subcomponent-binding protein, mitochondrial-like [Amphimedon queenslandica]|eukprot:XP_003385852.1 PREDICTED: complement component 1 Q subcomponent-binding protein, mitochondrial-like [Amphimedon queenslandica]
MATSLLWRNASLAARRLVSRQICRRTVPSPSTSLLKTPVLATRFKSSFSNDANKGASASLLLQAQAELDLESTDEEALGFNGFQISINGAQAILTRMHGNEEVKVELNLNAYSDMLEDELDDDDDDDNVEETRNKPFFLPSFTVTFTKKSGISLVVRCSVETSDYDDEEGWGNLSITNVSVVPKGGTTDQYEADTQYLSDELMDSINDYMEDRKINQTFAQELLEFYDNFERKAHTQFLKDLKSFAQS